MILSQIDRINATRSPGECTFSVDTYTILR
jgi:hypothetical protein